MIENKVDLIQSDLIKQRSISVQQDVPPIWSPTSDLPPVRKLSSNQSSCLEISDRLPHEVRMPKINPITHINPDVVIRHDEIEFELANDSYKKEGGQQESYVSSSECDINESGIMSEVIPDIRKISETSSPMKNHVDFDKLKLYAQLVKTTQPSERLKILNQTP